LFESMLAEEPLATTTRTRRTVPHPRVALATISAGTKPPATQKEQARDLLIATRDEEEDWWWRQQSDFIGLRPELTLEYHELARRRLFLFPMSPAQERL
jgi:hypothetical protein